MANNGLPRFCIDMAWQSDLDLAMVWLNRGLISHIMANDGLPRLYIAMAWLIRPWLSHDAMVWLSTGMFSHIMARDGLPRLCISHAMANQASA